jgi:adenosylcobinamide-phosphate synthase
MALDVLLGDPPNRWHPVAWMGTFINRARRQAPARGKLLYGGGVALGGAGIVWWMTGGAVGLSRRLPPELGVLLRALLLKMTFSLRSLDSAAAEVEMALRRDDLPAARRLLSWHLVSRKTGALDTPRVAAAAIQSVAENTSDGVIAPLFWYVVGGLPAAFAYRYLQTCDSLLGYRDAEREWLGFPRG